jgi:hypothetical protein
VIGTEYKACRGDPYHRSRTAAIIDGTPQLSILGQALDMVSPSVESTNRRSEPIVTTMENVLPDSQPYGHSPRWGGWENWYGLYPRPDTQRD